MMFANRVDAGRQLADALRYRRSLDTVVVGVTKGGVPVAAEIARALGTPLDICIVRKLVVQRVVPITIGAIAEGGATYFEPERLSRFGVSSDELATTIARETREVARLSRLFRDRPPFELRGRDVVLVDDGLVTGVTISAAVFAVAARGARRIELATPLAAAEVLDRVQVELDHVTCLLGEPNLVSIGSRYRQFDPVSEAEIITALEVARLDLEALPATTPVASGIPHT